MARPVPIKDQLQLSLEAAMLFAPFGCTHPPPPVLPFLLAQNLSPTKVTSQAENYMTLIVIYWNFKKVPVNSKGSQKYHEGL